jgi:[ribosomal protein S18]-alanine N-acetyltransferase
MTRLRDATVADVPQMMEIAGQAATAAQWSPEHYKQILSGNGLGLVLQENSRIIGFILGRGIAEAWEIENIAVAASERRRGLGSRLVEEFLRRIRSHGAREVFLEVRESNRAALSLYKKWSFIEVGRRKSYYHSPEEDALLLKFYFPDVN